MLQATQATVGWDPSKKRWQVQIQVGAEVIKRGLDKVDHDAGEAALRSLAIDTAKAEGYELNPEKVLVNQASAGD